MAQQARTISVVIGVIIVDLVATFGMFAILAIDVIIQNRRDIITAIAGEIFYLFWLVWIGCAIVRVYKRKVRFAQSLFITLTIISSLDIVLVTGVFGITGYGKTVFIWLLTLLLLQIPGIYFSISLSGKLRQENGSGSISAY